MRKKLNYITIIFLILIGYSCKNEKKNSIQNLKVETELKTDSINAYNELENTKSQKTHKISEYNTDNSKIEDIKKHLVFESSESIYKHQVHNFHKVFQYTY